MIIHKDSHTDHVSPETLEHVLERFAGRDGFFIETFELPDGRPPLPCALYGPDVGDAPVTDAECVMRARPGRAYQSRTVPRPARPTRTCTVIAGPYAGSPCVLFTAFGGPCAPKELGDPNLKPEERPASEAFWARHALASLPMEG